METSEIRRANLVIIQEQHGTMAALSKVLDTSPTQLSQIKSGKIGNRVFNLGSKLARKFEQKLGLPHGWFDVPHAAGVTAHVAEPSAPGAAARGSAIQLALVDTARRLTEAGLLSDMECLAILQGWNPLITQLPALPGPKD